MKKAGIKTQPKQERKKKSPRKVSSPQNTSVAAQFRGKEIGGARHFENLLKKTRKKGGKTQLKAQLTWWGKES